MSINRFMAIKIANEKLNILKSNMGVEVKIIEEEIIEKDFYWIFFYNSKEYIESKNLSYTLAGNSPFIIDKIQGNIYETGTAYSLDFYMEDFEKNILPSIVTPLS